MKTPIICVHTGKHRYLYYVLRQAKLFNENVILLGDDVSTSCKKTAKYFALEQFSGSNLQKQFISSYFHLSTNNEEFERACFLRWFQILEFMKQNEIASVIHIDSDNLIYKNLVYTIEDKISLYDAGYNIAAQNYDDMIWAASPHISFWKDNKLRDFCLFVLEQYRNGKNELLKKWNYTRDNRLAGGVSDMTLLYLYYLKNSSTIANLLLPVNDSLYVDQNINIAQNYFVDEFRMRVIGKGISVKDIRIKNGIPLCLNERRKNEIEFVSLHFQGFAKYFLYLFINWKPRFPERLWNPILFRIQQYKRKLKYFIGKSV